jgi:hypothetical protein
MAKIKMPLMGMEASGQLGKTLVYFNWKGLNCARMHVTPSNPNTASQQARRTLLSDAVDDFHDTALTDTDIDGWRRLASIQAKPMTYFNVYVKKYIDTDDASETWPAFHNDATASTTPEEIDFSIDGETGLTAYVRYGNSPSYMPNTQLLTEAAGTYTETVASLDEGAVIYYQFYVNTEVNSVSGIGKITVASS